MSEPQKHKGTLRLGIVIRCSCGWQSVPAFGMGSEKLARVQWDDHRAANTEQPHNPNGDTNG